MDQNKLDKSTTTSGRPPAQGRETACAPEGIDPATGMHTSYWVLSEGERAKGFVRPVRRSYVHVGPSGPGNPLRDLTEKEQERYAKFEYVKFEEYPESESAVTGRYWTQVALDSLGKGCGTETTMSLPLAETHARDPQYYGATFCVGCGEHFPVGEFRWSANPGEVLGSGVSEVKVEDGS